ncbi:HAD-IIA family hydrolase [Frankia sp. Cppng1_Ct_nod]|uniref:HAD-IIA family hydrolase n=1 Tax=Frankia sp. Cppng1_Ct_nod TaxID=2897162 RepID=UPI001F5F8EC8|nr:HAD-IIA family hydrolase [Frankia sp. Cppng1_Ct_nod]
MGSSHPLSASPSVLVDAFDVALMDLDGVVYRGSEAVPHASRAIASARAHGMRVVFVTNNALRTPDEVARRLASFGVPAVPTDVITSAQAAARVLAARLPGGAAVLVLGGRGLRDAVNDVGLRPVATVEEQPAAVVQGFDPDIDYARLSEAALAIRAGAVWVASNADATVPTERGLMPGNGSLVAMLRTATGSEPIVVGKPERALHEESVRRSGARYPLVVGDRLDTDISSAVRSGTPSLLVLTGVVGPGDLLRAEPLYRPTYLSADLRGLFAGHPSVVVNGDGVPPQGVEVGGGPRSDDVSAVCGSWVAQVRDSTLTWRRAGPTTRAGGTRGTVDGVLSADGMPPDDGLDALRAACAAGWAAADRGAPVRALAGTRPPGCADLG